MIVREFSVPGGVKVVSQCLCIALVFTFSGCSDDGRVPVFPVTGSVLVDGEVPEGAVVILHPVTPPAQEVNKPAGRVESDGTFRVTTYDTGDGAPLGEYVVTVSWGGPGIPDRLGGQFRDPETSQLKVTVAEGENTLPPFELERVQRSGPGGRRGTGPLD